MLSIKQLKIKPPVKRETLFKLVAMISISVLLSLFLIGLEESVYRVFVRQ